MYRQLNLINSNFSYTQITITPIIIYQLNLKEIGLQLCTCTWLEIMTCIGIALYLLYNSEYYLVLITILVFSPLIGFHFAISRTSKDEYCVSCGKSE
jgi:hypothetical protein